MTSARAVPVEAAPMSGWYDANYRCCEASGTFLLEG